ncbi:DUF2570 domain-containing protein [Bdellovibrio bacteriovorus]|uniref:DUF2570 domain-containing protein n=1 Tax=Bdellovibrio bacteriovorus TaxID=959 RepID=UPI0021D2400A|nr:DUF2570 domain-containing protein [Bdellovibrio bacteriovorus]UXR65931.1 DUF2570 domain-containing protein [Bdellovibrio bacteriovorus]
MLNIKKTIMTPTLLLSLITGPVALAGTTDRCKPMPTVKELRTLNRHIPTGPASSAMADSSSDAFKDLMTAIAQDAGGETSGVLAGWVLNALMGGQTNKDLEEIKNDLKKQEQMLTAIQAQLNSLSEQMKQESQAIMDEVEKAHYEDLVSTLNEPISNILAYYQQLTWLAQEDPSCDHKAEAAQVRDNIINNVLPHLIQINMVLTGQQGSGTVTPAIDYWRDLVLKKTPGYGSAYSAYPRFVSNRYLKPMNMFMDYYKRVQALATVLAMEAYHAQSTPDVQMAQHYLDLYNTNIAGQLQQAQIPGVNLPDDNLVIDTQNNLMWTYMPVLKGWDNAGLWEAYKANSPSEHFAWDAAVGPPESYRRPLGAVDDFTVSLEIEKNRSKVI